MDTPYSKDRAMTIGQVEDLMTMVVTSTRDWCEENVDSFEVMQHIGDLLNAANRIPDDTRTVSERAQAISASVDAIIHELTEAGMDTSELKTSDIAQCIANIAVNAGVYIVDSSGQRWTAASWSYAKQANGGVDPAPREGIFVGNSEHSILVASKNYGPMQFGTYGHTIPNLQGMAGGPSGTPVSGKYNARKILAATNPNALREWGWAIDYFEGMKRSDLTDIDVVFFPDEATLKAWATSLGLPDMVALGQAMMYVIPHATEANSYVCKYFNGTNSISFANREAVVPYTDSYGQIGCNVMETAILHKENPEDPNFWRGPSLFEALMMILNKQAINECRAALGESALPSGIIWAVLQDSNNSEYYFSLAYGSWSYNGKNYSYHVVLVAS